MFNSVRRPVSVTWLHWAGPGQLLEVRVLRLARVGHCGVETIVVRDIADSLDPAVRELDSVAAPGDARVGPLLRPVVVHPAVRVVHSEIVGVRLGLVI